LGYNSKTQGHNSVELYEVSEDNFPSVGWEHLELRGEEDPEEHTLLSLLIFLRPVINPGPNGQVLRDPGSGS